MAELFFGDVPGAHTSCPVAALSGVDQGARRLAGAEEVNEELAAVFGAPLAAAGTLEAGDAHVTSAAARMGKQDFTAKVEGAAAVNDELAGTFGAPVAASVAP